MAIMVMAGSLVPSVEPGPQARWLAVLIALAIPVGLVLRVLAASRGYNFDMISYRIVADIMLVDGNVYAETDRYNYGPIWFHILAATDAIPSEIRHQVWSLRWKLVGLLTIVDLLLTLLLTRWFGWRPALLFWLNPITIIITGYHTQFDNLAVLVGLVGARMVEKAEGGPLRCMIPGLLFLGVSLLVKHILFFFPIWLALKQAGFWRKAFVAGFPIAVFVAGFLPYLGDGGGEGVVRNVLLYRSFNNAPFWSGVAPAVIFDKIPFMVSFLASLTLLGLLWKNLPPLESLMRYLVAVVTFSAAVANQYLAIPVIAIATHWNVLYAAYSVLGGVHLVTSGDGLHWLQGLSSVGYDELIACLFGGLLLQVVPRDKVRRAAQSTRAFLCRLLRETWSQVRGQMPLRGPRDRGS